MSIVGQNNMRIYNFICGQLSYDAFSKWPTRSFGLATPALFDRHKHKYVDRKEIMVDNDFPPRFRNLQTQ